MEEGSMGAGRDVIARLWREHYKKVLAVAVVAWVVIITLAYHRISSRQNAGPTLPQGMVAKLLPVGALPVT